MYVHVPFCGARCAYCDFAIVVGQDGRAADWLAALRAEARAVAGRDGRRPADTVHLGGGTPSRLDEAALAGVLEALRGAFDLAPGAEVALEANPEDVTPAAAAAWVRLGFNRVTVGLQSLEAAGLAALGRPGTPAEGRAALDALRASGLRSVGADFIFGRPGQSCAGWERELEEIAALGLDHVSLYALETDARTPLVRRIERGDAPAPDGDEAAAMYEAGVARLAAAGLPRYELSNFARAGHESRHNLKYWTDAPYAGLGPAAASYVDGTRRTNPRRLSDYLRRAGGGAPAGAVPPVEPYDPLRRAGEAIVFGLRLARGVDLARVAARHGEDAVAPRRAALERAVASGFARREGTRVRLAPHAFLVADELFVDLL